MKSSLLTILPTELIYIPVFELLDALTIVQINTIKTEIKSVPLDKRVLEIYLESKYWESFKRNLLSNIILDKKLKKKSFTDMQPNEIKLLLERNKFNSKLNELIKLTGIGTDSKVKGSALKSERLPRLATKNLKRKSKNFSSARGKKSIRFRNSLEKLPSDLNPFKKSTSINQFYTARVKSSKRSNFIVK